LSSAFVFCHAKGFIALIEVWRNSYIYSYGFLIPFVSIYIVWVRKDKLRSLRISPNCRFAFPVLFTGLALLVFGDSSGIVSVQGISIVMGIISFILLLFGKDFLKHLWFPIAYLLFMVPLWDNLTEKLHPAFQGLSAMLAAKILHIAGIPSFRENVHIELPNITLEVAKVCSGVNNLIAVAAVAIPLAYLTLKGWPRRILLVVGGIAIAAMFNGLRIALIGAFAYHGMEGVLHGPCHIFQAMSVSIIGFIVLSIMAWMLSGRAASHSSTGTSKNRPPFEPMLNYDMHVNEIKYPLFMAAAAMILVGAYINF
jgi:exosortase